MRLRRACVAVASIAAAATGAACGDAPAARDQSSGANPARIVSLSPAITECVAELGLADRLVGRTPWCQACPPGVPVVGTLLDVDAEAMVRAAPTLVLVQPPAQGTDPGIARLAATHGWTVREWRINDLDDARAAMDGLARTVSDAHPAIADSIRARHVAWCDTLDAALEPLPASPAGAVAERVLVMVGGLEGISFGRGTYIDDALERLGVANALERSGYPALSVEDLVRIAPTTVIVIGGSDAARLQPIDSLAARVIRLPSDGLAVPGGRLPHGLKALRDALAQGESPPSE
jgi:ABC-type hemin transport system substrate-binding protein